MKTVLIADDHEIVRLGLRKIVALNGDFIFLEASACSEVKSLLSTRHVDYIILDLVLIDGSALSIIDWIIEQFREVRILVYSMNAEKIYADRLLRKGVHRFVNKQAGTMELEQAIKDFLNDKIYSGSMLAEEPSPYANTSNLQKNLIDSLSDRELEVIECIAAGMNTTEIANQMGLAFTTISTIKMRAYKKFGVENDVELKVKFLLYKF